MISYRYFINVVYVHNLTLLHRKSKTTPPATPVRYHNKAIVLRHYKITVAYSLVIVLMTLTEHFKICIYKLYASVISFIIVGSDYHIAD